MPLINEYSCTLSYISFHSRSSPDALTAPGGNL